MLIISFKASRRTQLIKLRIPYSDIEDVILKPEITDKDLVYPLKRLMKLSWSVPLPPVGGLYNGLARYENLVIIKLRKEIIIDYIKPQLKFVHIPEKQSINEIIINVPINKKIEFKEKILMKLE